MIMLVQSQQEQDIAPDKALSTEVGAASSPTGTVKTRHQRQREHKKFGRRALNLQQGGMAFNEDKKEDLMATLEYIQSLHSECDFLIPPGRGLRLLRLGVTLRA